MTKRIRVWIDKPVRYVVGAVPSLLVACGGLLGNSPPEVVLDGELGSVFSVGTCHSSANSWYCQITNKTAYPQKLNGAYTTCYDSGGVKREGAYSLAVTLDPNGTSDVFLGCSVSDHAAKIVFHHR